MTPVVESPAAERDLEDIWLAIAAENPSAATRLVRAIGAKIERLAVWPIIPEWEWYALVGLGHATREVAFLDVIATRW